MSNTVIAIKKSATAASVPGSLEFGELAINYADGKLYYKAANGTIQQLNVGSGSYFGTVNANNTLVVADTTGDILSLVAGNNIAITSNTTTDTITIGLQNDVVIPGTFKINTVGNDEGGEIVLGAAITNSTLSGDVKIDVYQNKLRFFESGSPNKGAYIDLSLASTGIGSNLLAGAGSTDTEARATAAAAFVKANAAFDKANSANVLASSAFDKANSTTYSSNVVISVADNSNAALRITQTGTGNALLVEDEANPDASPFVVTAGGAIGIGTRFPGSNFDFVADGGFALPYFRSFGAAVGTYLTAARARGTLASPTILTNGDAIGGIQFTGHDGTGNIPAALIRVDVDGVPGTNDMPGRMLFLTTADGAAAATERMRIDSAGRVGIGGTPTTGMRFVVSGAQTLGANPQFLLNQQTIQSDATGTTTYFETYVNSQATAFNASLVTHYKANKAALSGGATITSQRGFSAEASLTEAMNNYGFYGGIPAATGRWNFYAAGTAANYFAGDLTLGTTSNPNSSRLHVQGGGNSRMLTVQSTDADTSAGVGLTNDAREWSVAVRGDLGDALAVRDITTNVDRLIVANTGNVGIGITSPAYKLDVHGTINAASILINGSPIPNSTTYSSNVVISIADNSNAALRITQTGSGDALLIEDSGNPDSTPFIVNAFGQVGIGTNAPSQKLSVIGTTTSNVFISRAVSTTAITSPLTWNSSEYSQYSLTAQNADFFVDVSSGFAEDGQKMLFRFKDNGTSRAITWDTVSFIGAFRAVGVTLPSATVANKTLYVGAIYNAIDSVWDVVAVGQEA